MTEYIEREAALEESVELYYWCGYEDRYGYFVPVDAIQCIHAAVWPRCGMGGGKPIQIDLIH